MLSRTRGSPGGSSSSNGCGLVTLLSAAISRGADFDAENSFLSVSISRLARFDAWIRARSPRVAVIALVSPYANPLLTMARITRDTIISTRVSPSSSDSAWRQMDNLTLRASAGFRRFLRRVAVGPRGSGAQLDRIGLDHAHPSSSGSWVPPSSESYVTPQPVAAPSVASTQYWNDAPPFVRAYAVIALFSESAKLRPASAS